MNYLLPTSLEVGGEDYAIRWDYRAALDVCVALSDPELTDTERTKVALNILYVDDIPYAYLQEAIDKLVWYIDCGDIEKNEKPQPKLMDWEQDFQYIAASVNRVLGQEIRGLPFDPVKNINSLHWWTFVSAYYEIGECTFSQIVSIRNKLAKHKKLDKIEQEFYRDHRQMVDIKTKYTEDEDAFIRSLIGR